MNKRIICLILSLVILALSGCSNRKMGIFTEDTVKKPSASHGTPNNNGNSNVEHNSEETTSANSDAHKFENEFVRTEDKSISEVTLNPGVSSYLYFRTLVNRDYTFDQLQKCSYAFNIEEFLNYFDFEADDTEGTIFDVGQSLFDCPWNDATQIYRLTVKAKERESTAPNNFVFCIDVSESMASDDALPLLKTVFPYFVSALDIYDTVSIVTCTGEPEVILSGCRGDSSEEILAAMDGVEINPDTNSNTDITSAYDVAKEHFVLGGNNRVIIISDGDISGKLSSVAEEKVNEGIFTSVLGLGYSNYKNEKLESFANAGEGRYFYVDCESRGEKVLGKEIFESVFYEFGDITAKVEFDSEYVSEYRLIGYAQQSESTGEPSDTDEPRRVYAGDTMTICYELKLVGNKVPKNAQLAELNVKAEFAENGSYLGIPLVVTTDEYDAEADDDMRFMAAVIMSVMVLQDSEYIGRLTLEDVLLELQSFDLEEQPERAEFVLLIDKIVNATKK